MSVPPAPRNRLRGASTPPHIATLVVLAGASVMAMNIFLPMLPTIAEELNTTPAMAQYVVTLFLAATGISQLFIGPMADRYGRRPVLLAAMGVFIVATLVCIFATTIEMLLMGRTFQASTAACMALSRAILRDLFDRSKAASMIGYVTMAMAVIPMISPTLGGVLGEAYGWRSPFVTLLIVGLIMFALIWFDLGETHKPSSSSMRAQLTDYRSLLKEPVVWGYFICSSLGSGAYFAFLGGAPFVGDKVLGLTPSALGLYFAFVAVGYMFGNFLSGRFSERIGIEPMMFYGGLVASIGVATSLTLMSLLEPHATYLFLPMMLVGMGNGMTLPNANAGAISVRPDLAGSASGLGGFLQIGGGAALAALSGVLISEANQGMPLYIIMFFSSLSSAVVAWLMFRHSRKAGVIETV
ncbi:MAG: multidrug effflux MFS transporter [Rhizobiaceae bacterium]